MTKNYKENEAMFSDFYILWDPLMQCEQREFFCL